MDTATKVHIAARLVALAAAGVAALLAGCSSVPQQVVYAQSTPEAADSLLQACADHAAGAARASGQDFKRLKLTTVGRTKLPLEQYVGNTYIATVQDGTGEWYGRKEWRVVHYHCLSDAAGQVVYSFVRAE